MILPFCNTVVASRRSVFFWRSTVAAAVLIVGGCSRAPKSTARTDLEVQGRQIFRYDTFGDEQFWTDTAKLNELSTSGSSRLKR